MVAPMHELKNITFFNKDRINEFDQLDRRRMTPLESEAVQMVPVTLDQAWAKMTQHYTGVVVVAGKLRQHLENHQI